MAWLPYLNAFWRVPVIVLGTAFLASFSVLFSFLDSSGRLQHLCARSWGRLALLTGRVRVRVEGLEHLQGQRGYVFMANHLSMYDHWAFLACLPCQFRFVSKESLFRIPFLGWHLRRAGNLAVDRRSHRQTIRSFQAASEFIKKGISYVIYPEGGRSWGRMDSFKRGAFLLPVHAKAPIVPVTINNAHRRLRRGSAVIRPGVMSLIIHAPIAPEEYESLRLDDLARNVREIVLENYQDSD